jgi:Zn finger protein HypA/HybF involved in hydrogenase expression
VGLFDAVRNLLSGGGRATGEDEETFEYRCRDCDSEFESTRPHVTAAKCPECGSNDVRVGEDPYRPE